MLTNYTKNGSFICILWQKENDLFFSFIDEVCKTNLSKLYGMGTFMMPFVYGMGPTEIKIADPP
jgi:hypothetical protein